MSSLLRRRVGGAVTTLGALLLASIGNASGSVAAEPAAEPPTEPVAMHHTYVEEVVLSSAETVVLALANGQTIRVPRSLYTDWQEASTGDVETRGFDREFGTCGSAYIGLEDTGSLEYTMTTGFDIDDPAVGYVWEAYVNGADGTPYEYHYDVAGGLAARTSWQGRHVANVPAGDLYAADVIPAGSSALLANGGVCGAVPGIATDETIL